MGRNANRRPAAHGFDRWPSRTRRRCATRGPRALQAPRRDLRGGRTAQVAAGHGACTDNGVFPRHQSKEAISAAIVRHRRLRHRRRGGAGREIDAQRGDLHGRHRLAGRIAHCPAITAPRLRRTTTSCTRWPAATAMAAPAAPGRFAPNAVVMNGAFDADTRNRPAGNPSKRNRPSVSVSVARPSDSSSPEIVTSAPRTGRGSDVSVCTIPARPLMPPASFANRSRLRHRTRRRGRRRPAAPPRRRRRRRRLALPPPCPHLFSVSSFLSNPRDDEIDGPGVAPANRHARGQRRGPLEEGGILPGLRKRGVDGQHEVLAAR